MVTALTNFGDSAVLLPVATILLLWLGRRASALWWVLGVATTAGLIAILKLYFLACPLGDNLQSPSGHAGLGVVVYGGFAAVIARDRPVIWHRAALWCAVGGLVLGIAASRLLLGLHSLPEVGIGCVVGGVGLLVFILGDRGAEKRPGTLVALVVPAVAALVLFHGRKLYLDHALRTLGAWLQLGTFACF